MGKQKSQGTPDNPFLSNLNAMSAKRNESSVVGAFALPQVSDQLGTAKLDTGAYKEYVDNLTVHSRFNDLNRARNQSGWEQARNAIVQATAEVVGGTISGFGSIPEFFEALMQNQQGKDMDFTNGMMEFGEAIMGGSRDEFPIFRTNPNKAFDIGDSGWWWSNVPSVASSLSMIAPARAVTGGLSMLAKMSGISARAGRTARWAGDIVAGATVMRNAENMRESLSVSNQTREEAMQRFNLMNDAEFSNLIGNSEEGAEFLATGREINRENYANFLASKAGATSYKVNSANIVFDIIQTAAAYKALSGLTRGAGRSAKVAAAEAKMLGKDYGFSNILGHRLRNTFGGIAAQTTEGIEELINATGEKEGLYVLDKATGKTKPVEDRLEDYLGDGHIWEQGFWGLFGGVAFHNVSKGVESASARITGKPYQSTQDMALQEIRSREGHLKNLTKQLMEIEQQANAGTITPQQADVAKEQAANINAFRMGIDAAQAGQADKLEAMIASPDFKDTLMQSMSEKEKASFTDEKFAQMSGQIMSAVKEAEGAVKRYNDAIYNTDADVMTRNALFNKAMTNAYNIYDLSQENSKLATEYAEALDDPKYSNIINNPLFMNTVELTALEYVQKALKDAERRAGKAEKKILQSKLAEITTKVDEVKKGGVDRSLITTGNSKLAEIRALQLSNDISMATSRDALDNLTKPENVEDTRKAEEARMKAKRQADLDEYKQQIDTLITEGQVTVDDVRQERDKFAADKDIAEYLNKKITEMEEAAKIPTPVEEVPEPATEPEVEVEEAQEAAEPIVPIQPGAAESIAAAMEAVRVRDQQQREFEEMVAQGIADQQQETVEENDDVVQSASEEGTDPKPVVPYEPIPDKPLVLDETPTPDYVKNDPQAEVAYTQTVTYEPVDGLATLFIPHVHYAAKEGKIKQVSEGVYQIQDPRTEEVMNIIKSLPLGAEVELFVDTSSEFHKDYQADAAIGVRYQGRTLFYLNTESGLNKLLATPELPDRFKLRLQENLAAVRVIRDRVWNNRGSKITTTIKLKSAGAIIRGGKELNPLKVVAGSWRLAYTNTAQDLSVVGETEKYFAGGENSFFNRDLRYSLGTEYLLVEGFNFDGTLASRQVVYLNRGQLDASAQKSVEQLIDKTVKLFTGTNPPALNDERIDEIRRELREYIAVNNYNEKRSGLNGETVTIPKPYFKIHSNRIEFLTRDNNEIVTIWFKDKRYGKPMVVVEEWKGKKAEFGSQDEYKSAKGKVLSREVYGSEKAKAALRDQISTLYFNVDYSKLESGQVTPEDLFNSGRLVTDMGVLRDTKGNNLTNFWHKPEGRQEGADFVGKNGNLLIGIDPNVVVKKPATEVDLPVRENPTGVTTKAYNKAVSDARKDAFKQVAERKRDLQTAQDWIADFFESGGKVSPSSFQRHVDRNLQKERLNFLKKGGRDIADLAESLSQSARIPVTLEDIVDFLTTYKSATDYWNTIKEAIEIDLVKEYTAELSHAEAPTGSGRGWDGIGREFTEEDLSGRKKYARPANEPEPAKPSASQMTAGMANLPTKEIKLAVIPEKVNESNKVANPIELEARIYAAQKGVQKTDNYYLINGVKHHRVTNVIGSTFEGDSRMYENSTIAGSAVDLIVRDFFMGKEPINNNAMTPEAFTELLNRLSLIKKTIEGRGQKFLTNNIVVYDTENKVAGEVDILAINPDGTISIYDIKTSQNPVWLYDAAGKKTEFHPKYTKTYTNKAKTLRRSKKDQHTVQQSTYAIMFEKQYGVTVKEIAILPFNVSIEENGFIKTLKGEPGVKLERVDTTSLIEKGKTMPFVEVQLPSIVTKKKGFKLPIDKKGKDQGKASYAEGFIGYGQPGTSTYLYAKAAIDQGIPTNEDVVFIPGITVFVSVNGNNKLTAEAFTKTVDLAKKVIAQGGTIIMDSTADASRSWNITGELRVQNVLGKPSGQTSEGYNYWGPNPETKNSSDPFGDVDGLDIGTPRLLRTEGLEPATDVTEAERRSHFERMFGKNVEFDPSLSDIIWYKGASAYGIFRDAAVSVVNIAPRGTEYHEAMHVVMHLYLTEEERTKVYNEAREKYGQKPEQDLEEMLAEDFRAYANARDAKANPTGLGAAIRSFFERLYYAIKNYLGLATTQDLYAAVYSGRFNYTPDERTVRAVKGRAWTQETQIEDNFTPQEIRTYVGWAMMKVAEHIPAVARLTNEQVLQNPDLYNLRLRIKKELQLHYKTLHPNSTAAKEVLRIAAFWGSNSSEGFWKLITQEVRRKLNYDISYDENEAAQFEGNVEMRKDWDDRVAYHKSGKESFDFELKRVISTLPKLKSSSAKRIDGTTLVFEDKDSDNVAALPQPIDFNKVYPMLVNRMSSAGTIEEMISRMYDLADVDPSMIQLAYKLTSDLQFQARWFSNFNRAFVSDSHTRFNEQENEGFTIKVDEGSKTYGLANNWIARIQNSIAMGESKTYNGYTAAELADLRKAAFVGEFDQRVKALVELADALGMVITEDVIMKALNNQALIGHLGSKDNVYKLFSENLDKIANSIISGLGKGRIQFAETARVNKIAEVVSYYEPTTVENSFINTKGNVVFSTMRPSFITRFFTQIDRIADPFNVDKEGAKEAFLATLKSYLADPSFRFSNWIWNDGNNNGLLNVAFGEKDAASLTVKDLNIPFITKLKFYKSGDIKAGTTGASYADLSEQDWDIYNLSNYILNIQDGGRLTLYPVPVQSDSGNMWSITGKRYRLLFDEDGKLSRKARTFVSMQNIVRQEKARMSAAANLMFMKGTGGRLRPITLTAKVKAALQPGYHYAEVTTTDKSVVKGIAQRDISVDGVLWYKAGDPVTIAPEGYPGFKAGYPTGRVFNFSALDFVKDGVKYSLNDVPTLKVYGVHDPALNTPANQELIDNHIAAFADWLITEERKRYSKYKGRLLKSRKPNGKPLLENWLPASKDDGYTPDQAFNEMVAEFALNSYINNVEQAMFFTGVIPEYKNIADTNKRAKQMTAPAQTYVTTHRGKTYKALVVPDIVKPSNMLEAILENARKSSEGLTEKQLETKLATLRSKFSKINIADGQSIITLDRYAKILKDQDRWTPEIAAVFEVAKNPYGVLSSDQLDQLFEVLKPYYYGRRYNPVTNMVSSVQIKNSAIPAIPALIRGTVMEDLINFAEANGIEEIHFESAVKVGRGYTSQIFTPEGGLKEGFEQWANTMELNNDDWGIQLDVPDHIRDTENSLGVQIVKLAFANLSNKPIYKLGEKNLTGDELRTELWKTMAENIRDSSENVLWDLGAEKTEEGFVIADPTPISELLTEELSDRGASANTIQGLQLVDTPSGTRFRVPLSFGSGASKIVSVLTSRFTNNVTRQKFPGGHAVIATSALFTNYKSLKDREGLPTGVEFVDEVKARVDSGTFELKYRDIEAGNIAEAEVLLPAWSKDFYKEGKRISINEIPEELRTMIAYRIPTEGKYSTVVFKVVGFLPEASGSTIILPNELVTQTGWDFDVDSLYIMQKEFRRVVNGKDASEYIANRTKYDVKDVSKYIQEIRRPSGKVEVPTEVRDLYKEFSNQEFEIRPVEYNAELAPGKLNRAQRNNRIFDAMYAVLSNTYHYGEIVTPGGFDDAADALKLQKELLGINAENINPYTRAGQDFFRTQNMEGRSLKGMAANANSGLAVLQTIKAELREDLGFKIRYDLDQYNESELKRKYGNDVVIEGKFAVVNHRLFGRNLVDYTNVDGQVVTDHAAQLLAMVLDIVKEGYPLNFNVETFNVAAAMLGTGVNVKTAALYIRQPVINRLAQLKINSKSALEDSQSKEYFIARSEYYARLYWLMFREGQITEQQAKENGMWNYKERKLRSISEISKRIGKKAIATMNYTPSINRPWNAEALTELMKFGNLDYWQKANNVDKIRYVKAQLDILEQWTAIHSKAGIGFSDTILTMVTDKLGAGLQDTDNLMLQIARAQGYYDRVGSEGFKIPEPRVLAYDAKGRKVAAVDAVYSGDSSYPVFKDYLLHSNIRAQEVLDPLFVDRTPGYKAMKDSIFAGLGMFPSKERTKIVETFLNALVLDTAMGEDHSITGKPILDLDQKERVLGIKPLAFSKKLSFEQYEQLSTAQKLEYVQTKLAKNRLGKWRKEFADDAQILRRLTPKLQEDIVVKKGFHHIEFSKPKPSDNMDDYLVDSFRTLLNSDNEYLRSLGKDLVLYDYFTSNFRYTANSWSQYIPVEYLESSGIIDAYYKVANQLFAGNTIYADNLSDIFVRNHWHNRAIVPLARTYYEYDAEGNRVTDVDDVTGEKYAKIDGTFFDWDSHASTDRYFSVPVEQLKKESTEVRHAQYLLLQNPNEQVLFKRMDVTAEENDVRVYYYPVSKLGVKGMGFEIANETSIEGNKVSNEAYANLLAEVQSDPTLDNQRLNDIDNDNVVCPF